MLPVEPRPSLAEGNMLYNRTLVKLVFPEFLITVCICGVPLLSTAKILLLDQACVADPRAFVALSNFEASTTEKLVLVVDDFIA